MVFPDQNLGIAGFSVDEQDLFQVATDLHARPIRETSLKEGKTVKYTVPKSKLDGFGPYELPIPSMDLQWLDPGSAQLYGVFQIVKVDQNGAESRCGENDDYSVCNLPGNSMFKQMELMVGNSNVIDQSISAYHYKALIETVLSMLTKKFIV